MYHQLTSEQRYYIEVSLQNGMSKKMIAESLKVHLSTVYREISRNKGVHSYHHKLAQQKCDERKHRTRAIRTFTLNAILALHVGQRPMMGMHIMWSQCGQCRYLLVFWS